MLVLEINPALDHKVPRVSGLCFSMLLIFSGAFWNVLDLLDEFALNLHCRYVGSTRYCCSSSWGYQVVLPSALLQEWFSHVLTYPVEFGPWKCLNT